METKQSNKINELRSDEVQEILSHVPGWIIRWGITVFFFTLLMILLASWFIRYPEMISARVTITTENPPASIIARATGRLSKFINENDAVKKGQYLAMIENPARPEDIIELQKELKEFRTILGDHSNIQKSFSFNDNLILGELQSTYFKFLSEYKNYQLLEQLDFYQKQIDAIKRQIINYENLNSKLDAQRALIERELALAANKYKADQELFRNQVIPQQELDRSESAYIQNERAYENAKAGIISNSIQISELEKKIMEMVLQGQETNRKAITSLEESFKSFQAQFDLWEQQYLLVAPIDGHVAFFKYWSNNQFINTGEEVMMIVSGSQKIFGIVQMPAYGSGKVITGQRVKIKFDNYPANEYGMVEGRIGAISAVPRNNIYSIKVNLEHGLKTSYNKTLDFKEEMQGNAEIITENLRLIERIFNQFRSFFHNTLETA
ncbi:MAG: putative hemolysin secretion transport system rane protein [Bacteroidetes bacterium]|nr:putative hemolysin secretion transport system rane protein [Bacteroidota bacterium]